MGERQQPGSTRLVLASGSRYRRALLERLDVPFEVRPADIDETNVDGLAPQALAVRLAREKAVASARLQRPPSGATATKTTERELIIGSDQVVDLDGKVLGKPGTPERAVDQLVAMAGRSHRLVTAVCVLDTASGAMTEDVDVHVLHMRALDRAALERYVAADQPLDCAGSYKLEQRGIALFARIEADPSTADDTAIIGLPLTKLLAMLRGHGYRLL